MPGIAAWKILVPLAGAVAVGILMERSGAFPELGPTPKSQARFAVLGYLTPQELPDGVALLPAPPQPGSEAMKHDEEARASAMRLRGTPRFALAAADADRGQPNTATAFQCAFGAEISAKRTPALYDLLAKVRLDVRAATYPPKSHFRRPRPFAVYNTHTCYPPDEQNVRDDGSYPSARGAVGWAFAMVLAKLNPARSFEILQRGREFGQSRIVCDLEWQSDVDAGQTIAEATISHIREKPAFEADFAAARRETEAALRSGVAPSGCQSESIALASR